MVKTFKKNLLRVTFVSLLLLLWVFISSEINSAEKIHAEKDSRMENVEKESIIRIIEKAYIQGIHKNQDEKAVKSGFHQDFNMLVLQDNAIDKVTVDKWLGRIETMKEDNPELWNAETTYKLKLIDVASHAAVAILDVYKGKVHFSTDYMLLYKFEEGWKIVSKIFAVPK